MPAFSKIRIFRKCEFARALAYISASVPTSFLMALLIAIIFLASTQASAKSLTSSKSSKASKSARAKSSQEISGVIGWPFPKLEASAPSLWRGSDPILGRLSCPPLTRLNLAKQKFEPLILRSVSSKGSSRGETVWEYSLRSGIFWWAGEPVTEQDIVLYFMKNLKNIISYKTGLVWDIPQFQVKNQNNFVTITWDKEPKFGPYIINGVSLWRDVKSAEVLSNEFKYECAGIYIAKNKENGISLQPSKKYSSSRSHLEVLSQGKSSGQTQAINFVGAAGLSSRLSKRPPDFPSKCKTTVDLPLLTAISWNLKSKVFEKKKLSKLLNSMIPLDTILSSGAGFYGDLVPGPVPRRHPGFNSSIKNSKINLSGAIKKLEELGFGKKNKSGIRVTKDGVPLRIKIGRLGPQIKIVEKVIGDIFFSLGVDYAFSPANDKNLQGFEGVLHTARIPWPEMNLLASFHSQSIRNFPYKVEESASLDKDLEDYSSSLSHGKIEFEILKRVQKKISDSGMFSAMIHHSVCLETQKKYSKKSGFVNVLDPDWFRNLILR